MNDITLRPRWVFLCVFSLFGTQGLFVPLLLKNKFGLTDTQIGFVLGSSVGLYIFSGIVLSQAFDNQQNFGRKILLATCGILQCLLFCGLYYFTNLEFYSILLVLTFHQGIISGINAPVDGYCLEYLKSHNIRTSYGNERLFGSFGWAGVHLLLGVLLDNYGIDSIFLVMIGVTLVFVSMIPFMNSNKSVSDVESCVIMDKSMGLMKIVGNNKLFLFVLYVFSFGSSISVNLLFLYLEKSLKTTNVLKGVFIVINTLSEIPIFYYSSQIISRFGAERVLFVACLSFSIRTFIYALLESDNSWIILFLSPLQGISFACSKISIVEKMSKFLEDSGVDKMESYGQTVVNNVKSLGFVTGLVMGGYLFDSIGYDYTFIGISCINLLFSTFLYFSSPYQA